MSAAGYGAADPGAVAGAASAGGLGRVITVIDIGTGIDLIVDWRAGRPSWATGLCDARQGTVERGNKMRALICERKTARLKCASHEKMTSQRKTVGQIRRHR